LSFLNNKKEFSLDSGPNLLTKGEHMGKVIVIYHSQQFGNTEVLEEALAEGAREAGIIN
jgi:hypothetical protein